MTTTVRSILIYLAIAIGHFFLTVGAFLGGIVICNLKGTGTRVCWLGETIAGLLRLPLELSVHPGIKDPQYPGLLFMNSLFWSAVILAAIHKSRERRARLGG